MPGTNAGTGYPITFMCPVLRRSGHRSNMDFDRHQIRATGRTKKPPSPGKGNPRKADRSLEYECSCGHVGWSCHIDLADQAVSDGVVEGDSCGN